MEKARKAVIWNHELLSIVAASKEDIEEWTASELLRIESFEEETREKMHHARLYSVKKVQRYQHGEIEYLDIIVDSENEAENEFASQHCRN